MASTVSKTTFTSKITETISINKHHQQLETTLSIPNVTDYSHRIMSVATGTSSIILLGPSDNAGTFDKEKFKYLRITNLDDTNNIRLSFVLSSGDTYEVVINPKTSHILTAKAADITTGGAAVSLEDIAQIKGTATSAACDVEIFTVST
tara:strand:+ start:49 stop:495 length:447 start_codon:yes stop_codon:yes gene_type:complete